MRPDFGWSRRARFVEAARAPLAGARERKRYANKARAAAGENCRVDIRHVTRYT